MHNCSILRGSTTRVQVSFVCMCEYVYMCVCFVRGFIFVMIMRVLCKFESWREKEKREGQKMRDKEIVKRERERTSE
jgi:hypothetical protein